MLERVLPLLVVMLAGGCGAKRAVANGTWTGTIGGGETKPVGVQFTLEDEN